MRKIIAMLVVIFTCCTARADDTACPAGSYINADNECEICPAGTYSTSENATSCTKCNTNYPNSEPGATAATQCYSDWQIRKCPVPSGCATAEYVGAETLECQYRAYAKKSGFKYIDGVIKDGCADIDCSSLPVANITASAGYYINGTTCEKCPAGTASDGGDVTECAPCPNGKYYYSLTRTCKTCPNGYPNSEPGATSTKQCFSDTKYRPYDGTVECREMPENCTYANCTVCENEPEPCEYVEYYGGTVKSGCTTNKCITDVIYSAHAETSDYILPYNAESGKCEACGPGTYVGGRLDSNWNLIYECAPCTAGTYKPDGADSCMACPAGTYSAAGAAECTPCDAVGEYQPNTGATECIAVPDGYLKTDNTAIEGCGFNSWCQAGIKHSCTELDEIFARMEDIDKELSYYHSNYKSPNECTVQFPAGTELILTDNGVVEKKCDPGTYNTGNYNCTWAMLNTTPRDWDDYTKYNMYVSYYCRCNVCRPGTMLSKSGSKYECMVCPGGTYNVGDGNTGCLPCPAGTTAIPRNYMNGATECTPCPSGTYAPTPASPYCLMCPQNTYSHIGATECLPCSADASSDEYCGRTLNIKSPNGGAMTQILLSPTKFTSPSMNFQIKNRVFYADMTPVDNSNEPGMYARFNNQTYRVSNGTVLNKISTPKFWVTTIPDTSTFTFTIAARGTFIVDWGDGAREQRTHDDVEPQTYTHTYSTPGEYKVGLGGMATEYAIFDPYNPDFSRATLSFGGLHTGYRSSDDIDSNPISTYSGTLSGVFPTIGNGGNGNQPNFAATFSGIWSLPTNPFEGLHGIPSDGMFMYTFAYNSSAVLAVSWLKYALAEFNYTAPYLFAYMFYRYTYPFILYYSPGLFSTISGPIRPYMFAYTFASDTWNGARGPIPENFFGNLTGDDSTGAFQGMFHNAMLQDLINLTLPDGRYIWDVWPNSGKDFMSCSWIREQQMIEFNVPSGWRCGQN